MAGEVEHVLRGAMAVHPRAEGGKHIVIEKDETEVYRIPCTPEKVEALMALLAMDDEELRVAAAQAEHPGLHLPPGVNGSR